MSQLKDRLKLTASQEARIDDAVQRGKQRIEDLMRIPDASGKSPHERKQEQRKKLMEAIQNKDRGGLVAFATDMYGWRREKIPGQNTTYGDEIKRIKSETRDEINSGLSSEQQTTFKDTNIDPMLGAEGGMAVSMFAASDGESGDQPAGAFVVESEAVVTDFGEVSDEERIAAGEQPGTESGKKKD